MLGRNAKCVLNKLVDMRVISLKYFLTLFMHETCQKIIKIVVYYNVLYNEVWYNNISVHCVTFYALP